MGMHAKRRIGKIVYHVLIGGFGILMVYPIFWMIMGAFKNNNDILNHSASFFSNAGMAYGELGQRLEGVQRRNLWDIFQEFPDRCLPVYPGNGNFFFHGGLCSGQSKV